MRKFIFAYFHIINIPINICIYVYMYTEELELADAELSVAKVALVAAHSVSATLTAHHETAGMSQEVDIYLYFSSV
jgi:hypothetical protein